MRQQKLMSEGEIKGGCVCIPLKDITKELQSSFLAGVGWHSRAIMHEKTTLQKFKSLIRKTSLETISKI